jgi:hypothetical protein
MAVRRTQKPITINQSERVVVEFVQGASVERNVMFMAPDWVTPWPELASYSAQMDLRECPDDPEPLARLTSAEGHISLSDGGLIVWEIPESVSAALELERFGGDLFVYAPDGDAVHVYGVDFRMTLSHTARRQ